MELDPDEMLPPGMEDLDWTDDMAQQVKGKKPKRLFSKTSETARTLISAEKQCALFCGGKKCRYCSGEGWAADEMVIQGLYSHWVTDNILAMARPSNDAIKKHNLVQQFLDEGINSIINLQTSGEHSECGPHRLDPCGFLYNPQSFMEKGVFFYNFGWPDYGVASLSTILDMVKVMQFAVSQGKVAVHCHAGRGRTGVIIACYLVFTNRISGREAIHYVREKRPSSIQTRQQMQVIEQFEKYLKPFRSVFPSREKGSHEFSLQQYLNRQRHILHGYEARRLKHIPKVIYVVCERLLELAQRGTSIKDNHSHTSVHLQQTFSSISTNKSASTNSFIARHRSKESLGNERASRSRAMLGDMRGRLRSISLEDLPNDAFRDVLADPDDADTRSSSSSNSCSCSPIKPLTVNGNGHVNDDADDDDDDKSIVFGRSAVDLRDEEKPGCSVCTSIPCDVEHKDSDNTSVGGQSKWSIDESLVGELEQHAVDVIGTALATDVMDDDVSDRAEQYELQLNETDQAWAELGSEPDPGVLACVMWDWLDQLKEPILRAQDLHGIFKYVTDPVTGLQKVEKGTRYTIEYLVKFVSQLRPLGEGAVVSIYEKLLCHLSHQWISYSPDVSDSWAMSTRSSVADEKDHWSEMRPQDAHKLFQFFFNLKVSLEDSKKRANKSRT